MSQGIQTPRLTASGEGVLTTLRSMPVNARRDAIKQLLASKDPDAMRIAALAANEIPKADDSPDNKKQRTVLTK